MEALKREKPFYGVPFTTKDCFAVNGLSYTAGLAERGKRKAKGDFDADAVALVSETKQLHFEIKKPQLNYSIPKLVFTTFYGMLLKSIWDRVLVNMAPGRDKAMDCKLFGLDKVHLVCLSKYYHKCTNIFPSKSSVVL